MIDPDAAAGGGALIWKRRKNGFSLDYGVRAPSPPDLGKNGFLGFYELGRPHLEKEVFLVFPRGGALIWFWRGLENSFVGGALILF